MAVFICKLIGFVSVTLVLSQAVAELVCSSANMSVIGVDFDSSQNQTGDWQHSIVLSKRGLETEYTVHVPWNVEVGYQPVYCDANSKDSLKVKVTFSSRRIRNPEYKFYPGVGYYKYHPAKVAWAVAKEVCEKEGAHLAIINSQQEADALKKLIVSESWAHIGLVKHDAKGEFVTLFGDPISKVGFTRWYSGFNPASVGASYTGLLHKTEGTLGYCPAQEAHASICEQDL